MNRNIVLFVILLVALMQELPRQAVAELSPSYTARDLSPNIVGLLRSNAADGYFVVAIAGTPDFIQLYGSDGEAFLDFPMFTTRQKELRDQIEQVCRDLGLTLTITEAPNGAQLLDYKLPSNADEISRILYVLLERVYGANRDTRLEFEANGFELSAP